MYDYWHQMRILGDDFSFNPLNGFYSMGISVSPLTSDECAVSLLDRVYELRGGWGVDRLGDKISRVTKTTMGLPEELGGRFAVV